MNDQELHLIMKKYLKQSLEQQLENVKQGKQNQSFVFLDSQTLQMLLVMYMMNKRETSSSAAVSGMKTNDLEQFLGQSEKGMKEILDLLNA